MKKLFALAVLACSAIALTIAPTAAAGDTPCTGTLTGPIDGNVVVPPGASCTLSGATVTGNVKALENSKLLITSSTIHGNVEGDKADLVQVINFSTVRQNITIKDGGPAAFPIPAGGFSCVVFPNPPTPCEALVLGSTVQEGNVQIEKMTGSVVVLSSTVAKGNVKVEDNFIPSDEFLSIGGGTSIAENLQVFKNTGPGGKFVLTNVVGEDLQCKENTAPFSGGPNTAGKAEDQCF